MADALYESLETLRIVALLSWPIIPEASGRLWDQLGLDGSPAEATLPQAAGWGGLEPGSKTRRGDALFPRLEA